MAKKKVKLFKLPKKKVVENPNQEVKSFKPPKKIEVTGEFLRVQDVLGFFKYNINPSFIEAKIEKSVVAQMRGTRQIPFTWVAIIMAILIAGAIAYMIISGQGTDSACYADLRSCYAACGTAAKAASTAGASIR